MRLFTYVVALMIGGAVFLPWMRLDGESEAHSGAELIGLLFTPNVQYLYAVSPVQSCCASRLPNIGSLGYFPSDFQIQSTEECHPLATLVILASCIAIIYATRDLAANAGDRTYIGLTGTISLSAVLLVHQGLIKLRTKLHQGRKLPIVHRVLGVITGSGYYRWSESKAR